MPDPALSRKGLSRHVRVGRRTWDDPVLSNISTVERRTQLRLFSISTEAKIADICLSFGGDLRVEVSQALGLLLELVVLTKLTQAMPH